MSSVKSKKVKKTKPKKLVLKKNLQIPTRDF